MDDIRPRAPRLTAGAVWLVLLNTLALVGVIWIIWQARTVVSWTLIALLVALAAHPAVAWLARHRFRHGWAVLTVFVAGLGLASAVVGTMVPMLIEQGQQLAERAPNLLDTLRDTRLVRWADGQFNLVEQAKEILRERTASLAMPAFQLARGVVESLVATGTVVTLSIFMLLFGGDVFDKLLSWLEPGRRSRWHGLANRVRAVVGRYVAGTFMVAGIGGVVMGLTMLFLGVPYFLALGLAMAVLGIVPVVGSIIGAILTVGMTFATAGIKAGLIAAAVYLVYQQLENQILQPMVQRHTISMNPLLIALALLLGTSLAGVLGTLLALPAAGALQVFLQDALDRRRGRWVAEGSTTEAGLLVYGAPEVGPATPPH